MLRPKTTNVIDLGTTALRYKDFYLEGNADIDGTINVEGATTLQSTLAAGNTTISNPAGFVHNGSECGVAMVTNSLTSTQLFAIDNSTATETFVRKDNGNIVQILDYSAPLIGDDLTRTRSYVG